jgi:hypothetical protein
LLPFEQHQFVHGVSPLSPALEDPFILVSATFMASGA